MPPFNFGQQIGHNIKQIIGRGFSAGAHAGAQVPAQLKQLASRMPNMRQQAPTNALRGMANAGLNAAANSGAGVAAGLRGGTNAAQNAARQTMTAAPAARQVAQPQPQPSLFRNVANAGVNAGTAIGAGTGDGLQAGANTVRQTMNPNRLQQIAAMLPARSAQPSMASSFSGLGSNLSGMGSNILTGLTGGANSLHRTLSGALGNFSPSLANLFGGGRQGPSNNTATQNNIDAAAAPAPTGQDLRPMTGNFIRTKEQDDAFARGEIPTDWYRDEQTGQIRPMVWGP